MSAGRRVVVIGGGVAGITAALDCAEAGAAVTLVEVRPRLGGAAYSFERDGLRLDNGQHVFLRCCVAYMAFLERLGSARRVSIQPRLEIPVMRPGSPTFVLRRSSLPAPLHLAGALARYGHLSASERLLAARATLALFRLCRAWRPAADLARDECLDRMTFGEWLARHRQGPRALEALWDLIALPALNLRAREASLAQAAFVFHTGLLSSVDAGDIGFHRATLGETLGDPAVGALARAGVEVKLGWRAASLERDGRAFAVAGPSATGERLAAEAAIVAVQHNRAAGLLASLAPELASNIALLGSSPIVNLHVLYDREVCERPFAAGIGSPVQYVFDRSRAAGAPPGSQYLAVSLSGAEHEMQTNVESLRERYLPAIAALLPRARQARVESFTVTREHAATFRASPGAAALRPAARTPVPGLAVAGAYTDTGWPATLEGAVLSGHAAARVALDALAEGPGAARAPGPGSRVTAGANAS